MRIFASVILTLSFIALPLTSANALELFNWEININQNIYFASDFYTPPNSGQLPSAVNDAGFDWSQGLGNISITYNADVSGSYYVGAFFDHEIVDSSNNYFNEYGQTTGEAAAGQSWEIDEPGWEYGDIYLNFENATLDNTNAVSVNTPDDVSMALGWNFFLDANESATINFYLSDILPTAGFYLTHMDPEADYAVYFTSNLTLNGGVSPVPEPASLTLLGIGILGLIVAGKKSPKHF